MRKYLQKPYGLKIHKQVMLLRLHVYVDILASICWVFGRNSNGSNGAALNTSFPQKNQQQI